MSAIPTTDIKQRQREMFLKTALSYGSGVWGLLQDDFYDDEDVADCAYNAWAAKQAAIADSPWARWVELWEERYGRPETAPDIRLVIDNTRSQSKEAQS